MDPTSGASREKVMKVSEGNRSPRNKPRVLASLAEAIILQSIEDLWLDKEKSNCLNFFTGEGFHICAKLSGMDFHDKVKVLTLVKNLSDKMRVRQHGVCGRITRRRNVVEEKAVV